MRGCAASTTSSAGARARSARSAGTASSTSPSAPGWKTTVRRTSGPQQREDRVVQASVGGKRRARVDRGAPREVGEAAAGFLHEDLARCEIPGLEVRLEVDLGLARRHQRIAQVVAEPALAIGRIDQPEEAVPVARLAQEVEPGMPQVRRAEITEIRDVDGLAVVMGAAAPPRRVEVAGHRVVDDAGDDLPRVLERDQRGPDGDAANEVLRAVDGVDDPPSLGTALRAELLAEDADVGEGPAEHRDDRLLRLAVGLGHRGEVGLHRDVERAVVIAERNLARGARRVHGRGPVEGGRGYPSHSPRSSSTALNTSSASTTTGIPPYVTC